MKKMMLAALVLCLAAALLGGCGVADFDDSSGFTDPFSGSSSSQRTDYVPNDEILAINDLHNEVAQLYNEGAELMYQALEDGVMLEEGLEENYRAMADTIARYTREMEENLIDMTQAEGAAFREELETVQENVLAMREALDEALAAPLPA